MIETSFTIHVPATTANLGPGFDCLGLSLDLWNTITISQVDQPLTVTINGEGKGTLPEDDSNLILRAARQLAHAHDLSLPENLHIHCQNQIPISSGLGSSASAIIGGLVGARKLLELNISDLDILQTAAQIEGHADNTSACLFGGLILVGSDKSQIFVTHLNMKPITAVVAVPDFPLSTEAARNALPDLIPLRDAVFNINRTVELVNILEKGNYARLESAMHDQVHQVYRMPLLPGSEIAVRAAIDAGAFGACLSGAGPSVIAFSNQENSKAVGEAMQMAYKEVNLPSRSFTFMSPSQGCFIT